MASDKQPESLPAAQDTDDDDNQQGVASASAPSSSALKWLSQLFSKALKVQKDVPQILKKVSFKGIAKYIKSGECKNIITMVGAGISTSAGIPDFRSPGTGLYDNLQSFNLPDPHAIFTISYFKKNPKPFFVLAKAMYPGSFKPTPCHYFIRILHEKGLLLRHYTQNIDTLERVAGLPEEKLVEAHGTFHTSHCLKCGKLYTLDWMKEQMFADKIPACEVQDCEGVVKPDIVFFGETLPSRCAECVMTDFPKCDLLIIMGTSLLVQPFASLADSVPPSTPRLYINLDKGSTDEDSVVSQMFGGGFAFDSEDNIRDVFKGSTCDDGCQELADLLGWGKQLRELVKAEHARIDKETSAQPRSPKTKKTHAALDKCANRDAETSQDEKSPSQKL